MDISLRAATPAERLYINDQSVQIAKQCGSPGYLFGELDETLPVFFRSWMHNDSDEDTPEFKAEFEAVLDGLRFDERYGNILKNRNSMIIYCIDHSEGRSKSGHDYAFRADTEAYSYLIHCDPKSEDSIHVYIYPYRRECLDRHMKQAEKGIRFVTPDNKERFRIPDGETVRIVNNKGEYFDRVARYIDDCQVEIGSDHYHIREFAEELERDGRMIIPMRSSLPDKCYSVLPNGDEIITIKKGEAGCYHTDRYGHDRQAAQAIVDEYNGQLGVSKAQEAAMLAGSMFGWHTPSADPKNYDEQGNLIIHERRDSGTLDGGAETAGIGKEVKDGTNEF